MFVCDSSLNDKVKLIFRSLRLLDIKGPLACSLIKMRLNPLLLRHEDYKLLGKSRKKIPAPKMKQQPRLTCAEMIRRSNTGKLSKEAIHRQNKIAGAKYESTKKLRRSLKHCHTVGQAGETATRWERWWGSKGLKKREKSKVLRGTCVLPSK